MVVMTRDSKKKKKKNEPVTVRLFDINQHMTVNQFLEMCLSSRLLTKLLLIMESVG